MAVPSLKTAKEVSPTSTPMVLWQNGNGRDAASQAKTAQPQDAVTRERAEKLLPRIESAIKRIADGHADMRIPADLTDPDIVLGECLSLLSEIAAALPERGVEKVDNYNDGTI